MTTPLSDEELRRYTHLIDAILATADLETVTRKKVRKGLEKALGGKDLSDQKVAIKDLIEARFDAINSDDSPASNGVKEDADDEIKVSTSQRRARSDDDDDDEVRQPAKKHKRASSSVEDADARLAAELQAQENRLARARTTRGGSTSKPVKRGGNAKKKSAAKVKDEGSDSEGGRQKQTESPGADKEKRKAGGGFQKPFNLSPPLADLLGVPQLSRPQVVKQLWVHIKAHELQDPNDKRQIMCDDPMQAVFKLARIDMFQMNKHLSNHLYPVEEE